jgi:succinoglycan biosynthesis protein ExoO
MIDITVIIPAWNAAAFISNAVTSALRQDGLVTEVLVADDASTDATPAVLAAIADPRLRRIRLASNGGPAAARNAALARAAGRWIAVLDADDALLPGRLRRLLAAADLADADIIADNIWRQDSDPAARTLMLPEPLDGRLTPLGLADYLHGNLLFAGNHGYGYLKPLFRAEFLRRHALRYDETLRIGEDFHLVLDCLALGARYLRHASAGYLYTSRPGSISHRLRAPDVRAMIDADLRFLARFGDHLTPAEAAAARAHLRSLLDGAAFIRMVDSIKLHRPAELLGHVVRHPRAVRHFSMPLRAALARLRGRAA